MKLFTIFFALIFVLSCLGISAKACSCLPPSIDRSFSGAEKVLIGKVIKKSFCRPRGGKCIEPPVAARVLSPPPDNVIDTLEVRLGPPVPNALYTIEVHRSFKGCVRKGSKIVVETSAFSSACGRKLEVGSVWYLNIYKDNKINSCSYDRKQESLTVDDQRFLERNSQCYFY